MKNHSHLETFVIVLVAFFAIAAINTAAQYAAVPLGGHGADRVNVIAGGFEKSIDAAIADGSLLATDASGRVGAVVADGGLDSGLTGYGATGVEGWGSDVGVKGSWSGGTAIGYVGTEVGGKAYGLYTSEAVGVDEVCINGDCKTSWPNSVVWDGVLPGTHAVGTWACIQPPFDYCLGNGCRLKIKYTNLANNQLSTFSGVVDINADTMAFNPGAGTPNLWWLHNGVSEGFWEYPSYIMLLDCRLNSAGSCSAVHDEMNLCTTGGFQLEAILIKY